MVYIRVYFLCCIVYGFWKVSTTIILCRTDPLPKNLLCFTYSSLSPIQYLAFSGWLILKPYASEVHPHILMISVLMFLLSPLIWTSSSAFLGGSWPRYFWRLQVSNIIKCLYLHFCVFCFEVYHSFYFQEFKMSFNCADIFILFFLCLLFLLCYFVKGKLLCKRDQRKSKELELEGKQKIYSINAIRVPEEENKIMEILS